MSNNLLSWIGCQGMVSKRYSRKLSSLTLHSHGYALHVMIALLRRDVFILALEWRSINCSRMIFLSLFCGKRSERVEGETHKSHYFPENKEYKDSYCSLNAISFLCMIRSSLPSLQFKSQNANEIVQFRKNLQEHVHFKCILILFTPRTRKVCKTNILNRFHFVYASIPCELLQFLWRFRIRLQTLLEVSGCFELLLRFNLLTFLQEFLFEIIKSR